MKIKGQGFFESPLNRFDLLGRDETALSKAFAYILGKNKDICFSFLKEIGIKIRNSEKNFKVIEVDIEVTHRKVKGRTDIEISLRGDFHVIIECKVGKNPLKEQRQQYIPVFNDCPNKVLCFITQERDFIREKDSNVKIYYKNWLDIIALIEQNKTNTKEIKEFNYFALKGFKMRNQKEILIQDVGHREEVNRYLQNNLYRRDETAGGPLYFAPYFTRKSNQEEGISFISRVLGILVINSKEIINYKDDLLTYSNNNPDLVKKWLKGINEDADKIFTYYFLDNPVQLKKVLKKDPSKSKGRGKNWISAMIPKNRCVSFEDFIKQMVLADY